MLAKDENVIAGLVHLAIIFPGLGVLLPLIVWLIEKDKPGRSRYYMFQLKQALLWQVGSALLALTCIGGIVTVVMVVFGVIAGVQCFQRRPFDYPIVADWVRS
jgi:uncharacterized Tic20 family protein